MPTAVVFNPLAGRGRARHVAERAVQLLEHAGDSVQLLPTRDASGAEPILREVAAEIDRAVLVGGDGTLRQAVLGLAGHLDRIRVGILPFGNANILAHDLGIPTTTDGSLAVLLGDVERKLDLGRVNGEPFIAVAGIGFDARVARSLGTLRRGRLGKHLYRIWADGAYALAGLPAVASFSSPHFDVTVNGISLERPACAIVVSNVETYAKNWSMTPGASPFDEQLHYQARHSGGLIGLARQLLAARGRRLAPEVVSTHGAAVEIEVSSERELPLQIDGDYHGVRQHIRFTIEPAAWRVIVPGT